MIHLLMDIDTLHSSRNIERLRLIIAALCYYIIYAINILMGLLYVVRSRGYNYVNMGTCAYLTFMKII